MTTNQGEFDRQTGCWKIIDEYVYMLALGDYLAS